MIQDHNVLLFQNFYIDNDETRNKEFIETLTKNIDNIYIDKIILIVNKTNLLQEIKSLDHAKVSLFYVDTADKISYKTLYSVIDKYGQPNDICWWANLDIEFDETISLCKDHIDSIDSLICLSRHEIDNSMCINSSYSHDAWCFLYDKNKLNLLINNDICKIINFGDVNSELQNAALLIHSGFIPCNPANKIMIKHNHSNPIRNYTNIKLNKIGLPMAYVSTSNKYGVTLETLNLEFSNLKYSHFYYKHLYKNNKFDNLNEYLCEEINVNLNQQSNAISLENLTTELHAINIVSQTYNNVAIINNNITTNYSIIPGCNYIEIPNISKNIDIIFNIEDNYNFYVFTIKLYTHKEKYIQISSTNMYHKLLMFLLYKSINKNNLLHLLYEENNDIISNFFNFNIPTIKQTPDIRFNLITDYRTLVSQYYNLVEFPNIKDEFFNLTIKDLTLKNIIDIYLSFNNLKTTYVYVPKNQINNIDIINDYIQTILLDTKFITENDEDIPYISTKIYNKCTAIQITEDINYIQLFKFYLALYANQFIGFQDDIFSILIYNIRQNNKDILL